MRLRTRLYNATYWPLADLRGSQEEAMRHAGGDSARMLIHYALGPVLWPVRWLLTPKELRDRRTNP